jgi:hypothetical protein
MDEHYRCRIANFQRLVDERSRELAFYNSGFRICEDRNRVLTDVTDETIERLELERSWYQEQVTRIKADAARALH